MVQDTISKTVTTARTPRPAEEPIAAQARRRRYLALGAVFIVSVLIRLPYAQLIPTYTDEVRLVKYAVRLTWGEAVPLSLTGYNGPLMVYLIGAALAVYNSPEVPRLLAVFLGALLPLLTAMIGLRRGSLLPALIAAGLVSTSFTYVVIYSHLPWAVTLGLVLLLLSWWLSVGPLRGRQPYGAGFCYGLALQCYPLLLAFAPWLLLRHCRALGGSVRRLAIYLALLLLALSPVAVHHLLAWQSNESAGLDSSAPEILADVEAIPYRAGLAALVRSLADALSGAGHDRHFTVSQDPLALLFLAMIGLALITALIRRDGFVLANTASFLAAAPVAVRQFGFPMGTRYSALLLPVLFLAVAALARPQRGGHPPIRSALPWVWTALCLALMLGTGWRVRAYYREESARGHSNSAMNALVDLAVATCEHVVLDNRIAAAYPAGGTFSRVVEARLNLQGIRPVREDDTAALAEAIAAQKPPACAILSDAHLADLRRASPTLALSPLADLPASEQGEGMSLLRLGDLPAQRP